jgi:hypothetical protein
MPLKCYVYYQKKSKGTSLCGGSEFLLATGVLKNNTRTQDMNEKVLIHKK